MAQDNKDFTLEDILAEQRAQREQEAAQGAARPAAPQQKPKPHPLAQQGGGQPPVRQAAAPRQEPAPPQPEETADLNDFATGTVEVPPQEEHPPAHAEGKRGKKEKKEKKKKRGLFGRKKRVPDYDENEDDLY